MTAMGSVFRRFGRRLAGWWQAPGPLEDDSLRGTLGWPRDYYLAEERDCYVPPPCRGLRQREHQRRMGLGTRLGREGSADGLHTWPVDVPRLRRPATAAGLNPAYHSALLTAAALAFRAVGPADMPDDPASRPRTRAG